MNILQTGMAECMILRQERKLSMLIFDMKWYFYSRIVLLFSWLDRQAGWLWQRMSKDRASYWFDAVTGWATAWHYKSLNKMVAKTGRNLYGDKLC